MITDSSIIVDRDKITQPALTGRSLCGEVMVVSEMRKRTDHTSCEWAAALNIRPMNAPDLDPGGAIADIVWVRFGVLFSEVRFCWRYAASGVFQSVWCRSILLACTTRFSMSPMIFRWILSDVTLWSNWTERATDSTLGWSQSHPGRSGRSPASPTASEARRLEGRWAQARAHRIGRDGLRSRDGVHEGARSTSAYASRPHVRIR